MYVCTYQYHITYIHIINLVVLRTIPLLMIYCLIVLANSSLALYVRAPVRGRGVCELMRCIRMLCTVPVPARRSLCAAAVRVLRNI